MATMKWGMVYSLQNDDFGDELRSFGQWMVGKLTSTVEKLHMHMKFSPEPAFAIHCPLAQKERLFQTYHDISEQFGDVLYIVHVFAEKNSPEFTWVRNELSSRYALIVQGVLLQNALRRFAPAEDSEPDEENLTAIFNNMSQWICRRLAQVTCFKRQENAYKLVIKSSHDGDEDGLSDSSSQSSPAQRKQQEDSQHNERLVKVSGFPSIYTAFQLASLFSDGFQPLDVTIISAEGGRETSEEVGTCHAVVEFKNKCHAYQVVTLYNGRLIEAHGEDEEDYTLKAESCSTDIQRAIAEMSA